MKTTKALLFSGWLDILDEIKLAYMKKGEDEQPAVQSALKEMKESVPEPLYMEFRDWLLAVNKEIQKA